MARIVCFRSGEVLVSRRVPRGAMCLLIGHGTRLKRVLKANAVAAPDGRLMVPGIGEAATDIEAALAAKAFELILFKALCLVALAQDPGGVLSMVSKLAVGGRRY